MAHLCELIAASSAVITKPETIIITVYHIYIVRDMIPKGIALLFDLDAYT